jgi:hypothetical protein
LGNISQYKNHKESGKVMRSKAWIFVIVFVFILSCNLPMGGAAPVEVATLAPSVANVDAVGTSVELTTIAKMTEAAGNAAVVVAPSETPTVTPSVTPTQCNPTAVATADANIRSGPGKEYDIVGSLLLNSATTVAGRNDANTWWYVLVPGSTTNYGWIAGTVVSTSCLPQAVQVVAAPPTPIPPSPTNTQPPEIILAPPVAGMPDLVASAYQYAPQPAIKNQAASIMVRVTNNGTAPAGGFTVSWYSNQTMPGCDWAVQGLGVGKSKDLECEFTYNKSATYWVSFVVDSGNQVAESDEGNNSRDWKWKVDP